MRNLIEEPLLSLRHHAEESFREWLCLILVSIAALKKLYTKTDKHNFFRLNPLRDAQKVSFSSSAFLLCRIKSANDQQNKRTFSRTYVVVARVPTSVQVSRSHHLSVTPFRENQRGAILHCSLVFVLHKSGARYQDPMGDSTIGISKAYGKFSWVTSLSEFPKLKGKSHQWHHSRNFPSKWPENMSLVSNKLFPILFPTELFPIACSCGSASDALACGIYRSGDAGGQIIAYCDYCNVRAYFHYFRS